MKISPDYIHFIMEKLLSVDDMKNREMFGVIDVFQEGRMFALISEDVLYPKVNESNRQNIIVRKADHPS